jgi:hypothetical protein
MNYSTRLFLLSVVVLTSCHHSGEQALYYLPNHFTGNAIVVFNQPDGTPAEYSEGRRVYRIPPNGILKSQFALNPGWHVPDEYWYTDVHHNPLKTLRFIDRVSDADRLSSDTICCGLASVTDSNTPRTHYLTLVVSPWRTVDSIYELQNAVTSRISNELKGKK